MRVTLLCSRHSHEFQEPGIAEGKPYWNDQDKGGIGYISIFHAHCHQIPFPFSSKPTVSPLLLPPIGIFPVHLHAYPFTMRCAVTSAQERQVTITMTSGRRERIQPGRDSPAVPNSLLLLKSTESLLQCSVAGELNILINRL